MKNKLLTAANITILFIPWTILPLRTCFQWALDYADIMIPCYAVFMIFCGIFAIISYAAAGVRNNLMKVCLVVSCLYALAGILFLGMMGNSLAMNTQNLLKK